MESTVWRRPQISNLIEYAVLRYNLSNTNWTKNPFYGEFIQSFPSAAACARFLRITSTTVIRAKNNHTKIFDMYEIK